MARRQGSGIELDTESENAQTLKDAGSSAKKKFNPFKRSRDVAAKVFGSAGTDSTNGAGRADAGLTDAQVEQMKAGTFGKAGAGVPAAKRSTTSASKPPAPKPAPKPTSPVQYKPMEGGKIRFSPAVDPYVYEYDPQTKAYTIVEGPQGVGAIFGPDHPAAAKFEASRAEALQQSGSEMVPRRLQEARAIREAKEAEAEALQQSGAEAPATAEAPAAPAPEGEAAATVDDELMDAPEVAAAEEPSIREGAPSTHTQYFVDQVGLTPAAAQTSAEVVQELVDEGVLEEDARRVVAFNQEMNLGFRQGKGLTKEQLDRYARIELGMPPRGATDTVDSPASIDNPELPRGYTDPEGNFHRLYARGQRDTAAVFERGQAADEYTERTQALMENQGEMTRLQRMLADEVKANMQRNAPPETEITDEEVLALLEKNDMQDEERAMRRMLGL